MKMYVDNGVLVALPTSYQCLLGGNALMARKDDGGAAFIRDFNQAFAKLRESGEFHRLCEEANEKYGMCYLPIKTPSTERKFYIKMQVFTLLCHLSPIIN